MNAEIKFLDETLSLIHIPLNLYSTFLQPVLRVLLPPSQSLRPGCDESELEGLGPDLRHGFLNISVTPIECSIVCHSAWAKTIFEPVIKQLPKDAAKTVSISKDSYLVLCIISAGMDAGSRVVDLTSPLALAGIPIFFITTYYSDFILVPSKDKESVVKALLARGFEFSEGNSSYVAPGAISHTRGSSHASEPPSTPPPSTVAELQVRTFELLKKRNVVPYVEEGLHLIHCSGQELQRSGGEYSHRPSMSRSYTGNGHRESWVDKVDTKLYTSLITALVAQPRFLSVTLTAEDPPSLLLDKTLLSMFGDSVIGDTDADQVPIFLDLVNLPFEATGIVSGVAGRLVQELKMPDSSDLSYLSTARAGAVILSCDRSTQALEILRPLLTRE
ncbi:ACT-like protein [Pleurostoma richardsiae]|uniref:ACT-like protein n=1 Tax=Pleurostoma richardsiae TaxID=41990 RepID=A0AA38RTH7_9PEZI|nr:ACT-like protein [Pleurostoma richardsiae]